MVTLYYTHSLSIENNVNSVVVDVERLFSRKNFGALFVLTNRVRCVRESIFRWTPALHTAENQACRMRITSETLSVCSTVVAVRR
jgi:hypothetical protein